MAMITDPDLSRRRMIASPMSRRSCRAAGGLRRPSESRALPTFPSTIYFMMCGGLTSQPTFESDISSMQRRTKDPKTMASHSGIRGIMPSTSCRRRCIPSLSSCSQNNFGRKSDHSTYVVARSGKKAPYRSTTIDDVVELGLRFVVSFYTLDIAIREWHHRYRRAILGLVGWSGGLLPCSRLRTSILALSLPRSITCLLGLRLSSSSWSARRQIEFLVELKTSHT